MRTRMTFLTILCYGSMRTGQWVDGIVICEFIGVPIGACGTVT